LKLEDYVIPEIESMSEQINTNEKSAYKNLIQSLSEYRRPQKRKAVWQSLKSLRLRLWDKKQQQMVSLSACDCRLLRNRLLI